MMTSSNGNSLGVNGPLCGEFTGDRWIPRTKANDAELWCFLFICAWIKGWVNNREAGDPRRHRAHYDAIVILREKNPCPERPHTIAISQIPQCIRQISHNAPSCNRNVHTCAYFVITWCIVGYEIAAFCFVFATVQFDGIYRMVSLCINGHLTLTNVYRGISLGPLTYVLAKK